MFFVAITGGIASGKSTVAQMFIDNGFPVIDADTMARKVVEPGKKAWRKLKNEFGDGIFNEDDTLNREKLGEIIFDNTEKRRRLNEITHTEIMKGMVLAALKVGLKGYPFVVLDIPLLYESGELVDFMHKVIVVNCEEDIQMKRLVARNKITDEQAKKRISCQMPLESKCEKADIVVENSGTVEDTREQVEKIINPEVKLIHLVDSVESIYYLSLMQSTFITIFVIICMYDKQEFSDLRVNISVTLPWKMCVVLASDSFKLKMLFLALVMLA